MKIRQALCAGVIAALIGTTAGCGANSTVTQPPTRMAAAAMPTEATTPEQATAAEDTDVPAAAIQEADRTQGPEYAAQVWVRPYVRPIVRPYPVYGSYVYYPTYGYYGYYPGYGYGYGYRYGSYGHYGYRWGGRWGHHGYGRRGGYGGHRGGRRR